MTLSPHNGLGNVYCDLGRHKEAVVAYRKSFELQPRAGTLYGLGNAYRSLGRYEETIAAYQQAIVLDAKFALSQMSLAAVYRKLGDDTAYQQQVALAQPLIANEDEYNRACFASICGDADEALALLEAAIAKAPGERLMTASRS